MSVTALSKKQQKALLFRQKQKAKKTGEAIPGDVPEEDVQEDEADAVVVKHANEKGESSTSAKKRKRGADEDKGEAEDLTGGLKGKVKDVGKGKGKAWEEDGDGEKSGKKSKKEIKQRFILFIGNLGFKTTVPEVQAHFTEAVGMPNSPWHELGLQAGHAPQVRLLTEKSTRPGHPGKSRGIAFLEIPTSDAMQAALKLHHTQLAGRRINVELTAGGGGKSDTRTQKLAERNERVGVQRVRREEKEREAAIAEGGVPAERAPRVWGEAQGMAAVTALAAKRREGAGKRAEGKAEKAKVVEKPSPAAAPAAVAPVVTEKAASVDQPIAPAAATSGEAPASTAEYQDGMKIRGGRRVKVKAPGKPNGNTSVPGQSRVPWQDRQGGRGQPAQRGKRWEPTGANAMSVGS